MSLPDKPLLLIGKEKVCKDYGCSCIDILVHKILGTTQVQIEGHITDHDEIVDLVRVTSEISSERTVTSQQTEAIGIVEAMQEVRNALLVLKDAPQVNDSLHDYKTIYNVTDHTIS